MRAEGTCRTDASGPACRRGETRGAWRVARFAVVAVMAMVFGLAGFVASAEAALQYVNGTTQTNLAGDATYTVDLTGLGIAQGDLVIVATGFTLNSDGNPGVTPTGYTELFDLYSNDNRDNNLSINYKFMGATPDTQVTVNGSGDAAYGSATAVHVWRGVDPTTPMDVTAQSATGINSPNPNSPAITPTTTGAYILTIGGGSRSNNGVTMAAPTGYANAVAVQAQDSTQSFHVGIASIAWSGSGAEDPGAWTTGSTSTNDSWTAGTLALRPGPTCTPAPAPVMNGGSYGGDPVDICAAVTAGSNTITNYLVTGGGSSPDDDFQDNNLNAKWTMDSVGNSTNASVTETGGTLQVTNAGADLWTTSDDYTLVRQGPFSPGTSPLPARSTR